MKSLTYAVANPLDPTTVAIYVAFTSLRDTLTIDTECSTPSSYWLAASSHATLPTVEFDGPRVGCSCMTESVGVVAFSFVVERASRPSTATFFSSTLEPTARSRPPPVTVALATTRLSITVLPPAAASTNQLLPTVSSMATLPSKERFKVRSPGAMMSSTPADVSGAASAGQDAALACLDIG